jgi:hypothetical protein
MSTSMIVIQILDSFVTGQYYLHHKYKKRILWISLHILLRINYMSRKVTSGNSVGGVLWVGLWETSPRQSSGREDSIDDRIGNNYQYTVHNNVNCFIA